MSEAVPMKTGLELSATPVVGQDRIDIDGTIYSIENVVVIWNKDVVAAYEVQARR